MLSFKNSTNPDQNRSPIGRFQSNTRTVTQERYDFNRNTRFATERIRLHGVFLLFNRPAFFPPSVPLLSLFSSLRNPFFMFEQFVRTAPIQFQGLPVNWSVTIPARLITIKVGTGRYKNAIAWKSAGTVAQILAITIHRHRNCSFIARDRLDPDLLLHVMLKNCGSIKGTFLSHYRCSCRFRKI